MSAAPPGYDAPLPALSTMWAMQARFEHDVVAFARRAAELGYPALEINASMDAAQVSALCAQRFARVTAVHAPAPLERLPRGAPAEWNRDLNLAALDERERALAVEHTRRSNDVASEAGARYVVVHLGEIEGGELDAEGRLRALYARGDTSGEAWRNAIAGAKRDRERIAAPHLAQARRSLDELARAAEAAGVTLGLESRQHYHLLPLPGEAAELLSAHPPHVAGYWHDGGHAEVLHRLGLVDRDSWFSLLGERLVGVHLHDVNGLSDHRAPGNGDVDFVALARRLPPGAARTFEIDQHEPDDDVAAGLRLLRAVGMV